MLVVIKAVFVIFAARQKNKRLGIGHFRVQQANFTGGGAGQMNDHIMLRGRFMQADVIGIVFFFVNQFILRCWRTDGVTPDLIRQQRNWMLAYIVESPGVICPDKAGFNVIQQFRVPVTCFQITKTNAVLASGKKIFCQRHNGVIGRNRHSAHRIKLTMSCALVGIEQCFPLIPLFAECRLTLVDSIFTAWFINMPIAVAIFYVGSRNFSLRNAVDDFL